MFIVHEAIETYEPPPVDDLAIPFYQGCVYPVLVQDDRSLQAHFHDCIVVLEVPKAETDKFPGFRVVDLREVHGYADFHARLAGAIPFKAKEEAHVFARISASG